MRRYAFSRWSFFVWASSLMKSLVLRNAYFCIIVEHTPRGSRFSELFELLQTTINRRSAQRGPAGSFNGKTWSFLIPERRTPHIITRSANCLWHAQHHFPRTGTQSTWARLIKVIYISDTRSNRLRNFSKASELVLKYSILPNLRVGLLFT